MINAESLNLPDIIELTEYGGNFEAYNEAVYQVFKEDFVRSKPSFRGQRLRLKAHPKIDGKEYTYYHFTHTGDIENERIPDLRRMERIPWPKPIIESSENTILKVWRNKRGSHERILILHEDEKYIVILEDRTTYILPWTAFYIEHRHRMNKFLKEYEEYINTETAQND